MKNELYLIVGAAPFIVDPVAAEFRQLNMPENRVPWSDLKPDGDYFTGELQPRGEEPVQLRLPKAVLLENSGLSDWARIGISCRSQDEGWGFILGDAQLAMRLCGRLPHIDLAGTDFTVDWRLRQLRDTENPWNHIDLEEMELSPDGDAYFCFYNTATREMLVPDIYLEKIPDELVHLRIPGELKLDPVAVAREYGVDPAGLLIRNRFCEKLSAEVLPVSETELPAYVEKNVRMRDSKRTRGR